MDEQQGAVTPISSSSSQVTSNIAIGKKLNLSVIDKKTLENVLTSVGKVRESPLKNVKRGGPGSGTKHADLPKLELVDLPLNERVNTGNILDSAIQKHIIEKSIVSVGNHVFIADRLTGVPCPYYFFTIPSSRILEDVGTAVNGPSKGRAKKLHVIAGKFSQYHGAFATLDNLFTYLHCVMNIPVNSVVFRDILKMYHCEENSSFSSSQKLNEHFQNVTKSKVFGGSSTLTVPAQASRLSKSLKCTGCFFYAGDDESPFEHTPVKHSTLKALNQIPVNLRFPCYENWSEAVEKVKSKRETTISNHKKWKEYAEKHGKKATMELFKELKEKKKRQREGESPSSPSGIVELEDGEVVLKKQRIEDEDDVDISIESSSDNESTPLREDPPASQPADEEVRKLKELLLCSPSSNNEEEQEQLKLIEQFLKTLDRELKNPLERDPWDTDWGDDGIYSDIIESVDWEGVERIDDSTKHYKRKVKKIYEKVVAKK